MVDVSVLIVSYNTRAMTLECVRSLFAQTPDTSIEVIVVDNGSEDGSAAAIRAEFRQVNMLAQQTNLGFAQANNLAAASARGTYLLLLNPDTVILDAAVQKLHAFAKANPEFGIVGGRTLFADGSLNTKSCWRRPTPWSLFCAAIGFTSRFPHSGVFASESYGSWLRNAARQVDIVSGCFLLIRRDVWDALKGFDSAFFMYGEEADLCLRGRSLGFRCCICPDATIVHHGGASEKTRADKMIKLFTAKAMLAERHWSWPSRLLAPMLLDVWAATRVATFAALRLVRSTFQASYETWKVIWAHRGEWHVRGADFHASAEESNVSSVASGPPEHVAA